MAEETKDEVLKDEQPQEQAQANEETQAPDEVGALTAQIAELEEKYAAMEDKYLRAQAEMANMHTRFKKEQEQLLKYEGQS